MHNIEFPIASRDVHKRRVILVVNQKATKNIEVTLRKLSPEDQAEFKKAMRRLRPFEFVSRNLFWTFMEPRLIRNLRLDLSSGDLKIPIFLRLIVRALLKFGRNALLAECAHI